MILLGWLVVASLTVPLLGGRTRNLSVPRPCCVPALCCALAIQILALEVLSGSITSTTGAFLHLASYLLAVAFVWRNRQVPGLGLIGLGGLLNLVAIAANGGTMPASAAARAAAGLGPAVSGFSNSVVVDNPRLALLGDIFAWPAPLPLANVFSIGDVLLVVGAVIVLHCAFDSRLGRRLDRRDRQAVAMSNTMIGSGISTV